MTMSETNSALYWRNAYEELVRQTGRDLNDGLGPDPRKTHMSPLARHQGQEEAKAASVEGVSREDVAAIIANNRPAKSALRKADDILALFAAALQDLAGIRGEKATKALQDKGLILAGVSRQDPRERIAELEAALRKITKIKAERVTDDFVTGPRAHFDAAKRIAREALTKSQQEA